MLDDMLEADVSDELLWDPKVDAAAVAVDARHGVITLRGSVGSFREKREAKRAAQRVYGVKHVDSQLEVHLLDRSRRKDADIRGAVLQLLMLDSLVPATIDADVDDGVVTLTGAARYQYQREEAEFLAGNVVGVLNVWNEVELLAPGPEAGGVRESIEKAFQRNAKLDAEEMSVATSNGTVTLSGVVSSWGEHDDAVAAAWAAPGVRDVDDRITVEY